MFDIEECGKQEFCCIMSVCFFQTARHHTREEHSFTGEWFSLHFRVVISFLILSYPSGEVIPFFNAMSVCLFYDQDLLWSFWVLNGLGDCWETNVE